MIIPTIAKKLLPKVLELPKHIRREANSLEVSVNVPEWNVAARKIFGSRIRKKVPATEEGLIKAKQIVKDAQDNAYGGYKILDDDTFLALKVKYPTLNQQQLSAKLDELGYITPQLRKFKIYEGTTVTPVQKYIKRAGLNKKRLTVPELLKIVKAEPGGKAWAKSYNDKIYTEKQLREKVQNILRGDKKTTTAVSEEIYKTEGTLRGVNPPTKVFTDMIRAANKGNRIIIVKKPKTGGPDSYKDYVLVDTQASYKGGPKGAKEITIDNLEDFMENSVGRGLGEGSFARSTGAYEFQNILRKYPVTYRGEEMKLGHLLSNRKYLPEDARKSFFSAGKHSRAMNEFNVEHFEGVANNPYSTRIATRLGNKQMDDVVDNSKRIYEETGDPELAFKSLLQDIDNRGIVGMERTVTYGDTTYGVQKDLTLPSLFKSISNQLGPEVKGGVGRSLMGASKRLEKDPIFVNKYKDLLNFKNKGGRVEYADGAGPAGVQPIDSPKTTFDSEVRQMMDLTGLGLGDSVLELMKDRAAAIPIKDRKNFASGGSVGGGQFGFEVTNKVGAVESLLSGIASGLIDIPKGAFTLGTSLLDLGFGTNNAAKVSAWFDDLTKFDEKAKEHWLGEIAKVGVNLGIPGYYGWKAGAKLAEKALLAKRNGNYFKLTDPALVEKFNTSLNAGGRLMATLGGAAGAGVTDAIFVGDPEGVGTFGDMVGGGPTELDPNDEKIASREIVNRMKFGLDGSLFLGLIGGTGSSIKSLYRRRNDLASNNDAIDKFLAAFRPRGRKSQEYFDMERRNIGVRATDINFASQEARKLDKHIDAIFPFIKNPFNQMGNKGRTEFMDKLNETLLSGESVMNGIGKVEFGTMDKTLMDEVTSIMKSRGAKQKDIEGVFDSFEAIRGRWGRMFSRLGTTMDDDVRKEFAPLFAKKFKDYLGSTYEIFQNKSLLPLFRYKPTQESLDKVIKIFQDSAEDAGKPITREQAEFYANQVVETAKLPRDLATAGEKTSGIYFNAPDFFANRTTLSEIEGRGTVALEDLINTDKKAFGELFGKVSDPMQTMLTGTNRLSLIARRNQFFNELLKSDELMTAERAKFLAENPGGVTPNTMRGFFRETEREAVEAFGQNIKQIDIDPSRTIEAGITNPLNGKYAEKGVAEAIEESSMIARDKSTLQQLYDSFVLYPKATSQMAKTILSPVTHVRNFISAGAFASSNGLFLQSPDEIAAAMKDAFKALQIPGSRMANDEYRKLLSLGVVNSNVRLGDLTKLLKDTNFGETVNSRKALRGLMRPLSKAKKWTEDMYTAEDDFWKITSYALERRRLAKSYEKYGINKTIDELDEEAADIIRNQIPNYDMVNDFIRATRKLPLGNFVSFPAEIMRTTANILQRGLKEVNYTHTLDDGRIVHPLRNIGYKRLFGLGTTVVAIPYGTVEAAKAIYDVTEDEMKALRRFVPDWSKNSTLVPIRGEDGELKYIDFSHANAYDTMIRPITALYTGIQRGMDEGEIGREVMKGMWEGTKETLSPFVSESIWTTAISDIFLRGGRTREGNRLWTDETPWGERINKAVMHAAKTQFPGSIETFKRMDLAIEPVDIIMKGKYDKYGQAFELGDELLGFAGMRAVKVDPLRAMKFKIADFRTGINNARREFTSPLLRGGPVTPEQIVDRYKVASEALYRVQEKMHRDYMAALTLGTGVESLDLEFADRVSNVQLDSIKRGLFKPFIPSENIEKAFRENAIAIGDADPYRRAKGLIERLIKLYDGMPLGLRLPDVNNPFRTSAIGNLPIAGSPAFQGLMNSPATAGSITVGAPNVQQQQQTAMAGQRVFGANDPIFGVG